jgi:chromosome segregation ATPase
MNSFFKKAIGLFVVLDEEDDKKSTASQPAQKPEAPVKSDSSQPTPAPRRTMNATDISKFEKHFQELFDKANLPGPDYYEFWKMMDTLESHIPEEKARMKAVFESLKIQGLSKKVLLESAATYKQVVETDRSNFESAVKSKVAAEVESRQNSMQQLKSQQKEKEQLIKQMQEEIAAAKTKIATLEKEIEAEKEKIEGAQNGYLLACEAMVSKITQDIQTFENLI